MENDTISSDAEKEAAGKQGWTDKDVYKGDPEAWKPAKQFIEDGEKIAGLQVKKAKALEEGMTNMASQLKEVAATNAELKETMRLLAEHNKQSIKKVKTDAALKIAELTKKKHEAIEARDVEGVKDAEAEIEMVKDTIPEQVEKVEKAEKTPVGGDPVLAKWVEDNPWYYGSPKVKMYTDTCAEIMAHKIGDKRPFTREELDTLTEQVKEEYPEEFGNPKGKRAPAVNNGGPPAVIPKNKRVYENLPPEAKKNCDRFLRDIPNFTKEQYCTDYWGDEG